MFYRIMYLIVTLVFSHLGFWSGNLFLMASFPDLCLLVPFYEKVVLFYAIQRFDIVQVISSMVGYPYQDNISMTCIPLEPHLYTAKLGMQGYTCTYFSSHEPFGSKRELIGWLCPVVRPTSSVNNFHDLN